MTTHLIDQVRPWLDEPPANWRVAPLGHLVDLMGGATPSKDEPAFWQGSIPWVSPKDMKRDVIGDSIDHVSEDALASSSLRLVPERAVLTVVRGMILAHTVPVALTSAPVTLNQDMKALLARPGVAPEFLAWALRAFQNALLALVEEAGHGTKKLRTDLFKKFLLLVPSEREQRAIAAFLDRRTADIDSLIEKKQRLIRLLLEKRQALITQAVTKGLDPSVPMKDSGIAWIGEIPAHWEVKRLKHIARVQSGIAKGRKLDGPAISLPYLRVANVQDGYVDLSDVAEVELAPHEVSRFSLRPGDLLMNEGGDNDKVGRGAVWAGQIEPCAHQNHVFAVRPMSGMDPHWMALAIQSAYLKHFFLRRSKQSTNLASISSTNLKEAPFLMPPMGEAAAIRAEVERRLGNLRTLADKVASHIDLLREYRQAVITAAVTGKLDLSEGAA